jgi:hypothetical protein
MRTDSTDSYETPEPANSPPQKAAESVPVRIHVRSYGPARFIPLFMSVRWQRMRITVLEQNVSGPPSLGFVPVNVGIAYSATHRVLRLFNHMAMRVAGWSWGG